MFGYNIDKNKAKPSTNPAIAVHIRIITVNTLVGDSNHIFLLSFFTKSLILKIREGMFRPIIKSAQINIKMENDMLFGINYSQFNYFIV